MLGERRVAGAVTGRVGRGSDQVDAGAVAVVVDGLFDPVAVGVELGPDVGQRVPLGRVLQRQRDHVVGPHVDVLGVAEVGHLAHVDVVEDARVALHVLGRRQPRRRAPLVEGGAAREVERQAEAEADAGLDLAHALEDLLRREQVDAAELVVVAPVAPGRAVRALLSTASSRLSSRSDRLALHVPTGWSTRNGFAQRNTFPHRAGWSPMRMTQKDFVVSADGHLLEPIDLFKDPPARATSATWRCGRRRSRSSPSSRAAPGCSASCTRPASRAGRCRATARRAGARPRAIPRSSSRTWTSTASTPRCSTRTCRSSGCSPTTTRCRSPTPASTTTT